MKSNNILNLRPEFESLNELDLKNLVGGNGEKPNNDKDGGPDNKVEGASCCVCGCPCAPRI